MSRVPAYCESCGAVFQPNAIGLGPGARGTLLNNKVGCSSCGGLARLIDGTFTVSSDDVLIMVSGPPISRVTLQKFSALIHHTAKNQIALDALESEAAALDPVLGK